MEVEVIDWTDIWCDVCGEMPAIITTDDGKKYCPRCAEISQLEIAAELDGNEDSQ